MTQPHYIDRSAAIADIRHCIAVASQSQPDWREVWEDALKSLTDTPMEAVAWRLRRVGSEQWNFWDTPPWLALPVYADATKWEVQALAVIPTEGGEGRETEGPGS